ncbi:MAG: hypothetical protein U5N27_11150 [Rhizobium sp.]|nr:hypothetical protein [Rhizobium sp.]
MSVTRPLFSVPTAPLVPIHGRQEGFPIHRIFCVGRNYAAHAAELGNTVDRVAPFYFTKPPTGLVLEGGRDRLSTGHGGLSPRDRTRDRDRGAGLPGLDR